MLTCISILVLISCHTGNYPTPDESILPLEVGKTWIGLKTYYNSAGNILSTKLDTMFIEKAILINNETWYRLNDRPFSYINRSDGLWLVMDGLQVNNLIAKYPCSEGDSFGGQYFIRMTQNGEVQGSSLFYHKVISKNELIKVPAGEFNCYHYREFTIDSVTRKSEDNIPYSEGYYSVGVGFIKTKYYEPTKGDYNIWELIKVYKR